MDLLLNSNSFHYGVKCSFHGEKFSPRCFSSLSCQQHFHICTKHRKILFLLKALREFFFLSYAVLRRLVIKSKQFYIIKCEWKSWVSSSILVTSHSYIYLRWDDSSFYIDWLCFVMYAKQCYVMWYYSNSCGS